MKLDGRLPNSLDQLTGKKREDGKTMEVYLNYVLPCVVGKNQWNQQRHEKLVREFVTPSDEAFGYLILENIWDTWKGMSTEECHAVLASRLTLNRRASGGGTKKETGREGKWTDPTKSKEVSSRRFRGWDPEGIRRFNELIKEVMDDRKTDTGEEFEKQFQQAWLKIESEKGKATQNTSKCGEMEKLEAEYQDEQLKGF